MNDYDFRKQQLDVANERIEKLERQLSEERKDHENTKAIVRGVTHHDECWKQSPLYKMMREALSEFE